MPPETALSWLTQKVPIWGVLLGMAFGSGMGVIGTSWRTMESGGFDQRSDAIVAEHIAQLRTDQITLTTELRQAVATLREALDKKIDIEAKKDLVDNIMHRLDAIERHADIQDDRFNALLDNIRVGRPH